MRLHNFIIFAQQRFAAHRRYRQTVAEIDAMSNKDLLEIGVFQSDLYKAARNELHGA